MLLVVNLPPPAEVEYALRCMFSNTPISGRRAGDGGGSNGDTAAVDDAGGRVIKVIADKRALQVMPQAGLASVESMPRAHSSVCCT